MLGAEAAPATFAHRGKTYTLAAIDQRFKSAVERSLKARAFQELYDMRDMLAPEQYQHLQRTLLAERRRFVFFGDSYWEALATDDGSAMLVGLVFGCPEAEAAVLLRERPVEVEHLYSEQVIQSLPREKADLMRKAIADARAKAGGEKADPTRPA